MAAPDALAPGDAARPDDPPAAGEDLDDARRLLRKWEQPQRQLWQRLLRSGDGLFGA